MLQLQGAAEQAIVKGTVFVAVFCVGGVVAVRRRYKDDAESAHNHRPFDTKPQKVGYSMFTPGKPGAPQNTCRR